MNRNVLRAAAVTAMGGAMVLGTSELALATDCVIGVHSTNAPASANWVTFTALDAAQEFAQFDPACPAQVTAGYAALKAAGLPSALKIRTDKEIGANNSSPRMADGKGLDHFEAGSPYPDLVLGAFLGAASATACT